ncbi:MAG TPA: hypothetical protein DIU07_16020 [Rhodobacteraceae bacterium]|nr:hypothetical protein [Paracoccaceae bacterium]
MMPPDVVLDGAGFGIFNAAVAAYFAVTPLLFLFLAVAARGRDKFSLAICAATAALFALQWASVGPPYLWPDLSPFPILGLFPVAMAVLVFKLVRDRRRNHVRTTGESLAVLTLGAIFLSVILMNPFVIARF